MTIKSDVTRISTLRTNTTERMPPLEGLSNINFPQIQKYLSELLYYTFNSSTLSTIGPRTLVLSDQIRAFPWIRQFNLLVPTQRQTLGSNRVTGGALQTLNKDCEAHSCRRVKQYRPDQRGNVFPTDQFKFISVNLKCEN